MYRRILAAADIAFAVIAASAVPAAAQQSITFQLGGFLPRGEDGRPAGDVLVVNRQYLVFDVSDFNGFTFGGEWAIGLGEYFEAGVGLGYYQDTVTTIYDAWVNADGSEIMQDLKLRIVPITAVARILPLGNKRAFQPYVGGGLGIYSWKYSETGEFVDFADNSIYRDSYVASGTSVGPVAVFGARGRLSRSFTLGMEVRLQWGEANLSQDFLGDKLDLSGTSILSTFTYRF
jgi:opacity protein-like surface antigen